MGVINWVAFGGILVDLVIISMIISSTYWGYRRGLTAVIFKVLVFILSLLIVFCLYKPVSTSIMNKTGVDEWLTEKIRNIFEGTDLKDGKFLDPTDSNISEAVCELVNSFVSEALKNPQVDAVGYASRGIAEFMIRGLTMLFLLIISRCLLLFVRFAAEIIANLPFIRLFNKSGGLLYGIIKGFLMVYLILAVLSMLSPFISDLGIISAIEDSSLGNKMYNDNIIIDLIIK